MTREEAAELSPVIQAFSEGRPIQYRLKDVKSAKWHDIYENYHEFNPHSFQYRIKPEPKYHPFEDIEECWQEMQKHQPFGWIKSKEDGSRSLITLIISEENIDINCIGGFNSDKIMKRFTFADGAVFGILEEE